MRVLIVAKTHMQRLACVRGLALNPDRNVRLMQPGAGRSRETHAMRWARYGR